MLKNCKQSFFVALVVMASLLSSSAVTVPNVFSSNMVLQRDAAVPIWGWGNEGETVMVTFRNQKVSAKVKDGKWMVKLKALKAGGPDVLTIAGENTIELTNVLVGEVWVASGQSNMEFSMIRKPTTAADLPNVANPMIHWLNVANTRLTSPTNNIKGEWTECNPTTMRSNSAVAYYFARDLQKALGVPVGVMQSDWGGTPAEAWTRREWLLAKDYGKDVINSEKMALALAKKKPAAAKEAKPAKPAKSAKAAAPRQPWLAGELYNGMIAPLIPYAIKGVIWYQGENNASSPANAWRYHSVFPDLIRNWRADWQQGEFPFICVQLAPFATPLPNGDFTSIREAQLRATQTMSKVGMAVITDIGEEHDIHPANKQPVGVRLALAARAIAYGEKIEYSGPIYKKMKVKDGKVTLSFDHARSGLEAHDGELKGFTICGDDKNFVPASAVIEGNKITVTSPEVPNPVAVRYGWANYPVVNLWNKEGLPASPFRTDDFSLVSP